MSWTRKFDAPIALKDGRKLASLDDARRLMLSLPESRTASLPLAVRGRALEKWPHVMTDGSPLARALAQLPQGARGRGTDLGTGLRSHATARHRFPTLWPGPINPRVTILSGDNLWATNPALALIVGCPSPLSRRDARTPIPVSSRRK